MNDQAPPAPATRYPLPTHRPHNLGQSIASDGSDFFLGSILNRMGHVDRLGFDAQGFGLRFRPVDKGGGGHKDSGQAASF